MRNCAKLTLLTHFLTKVLMDAYTLCIKDVLTLTTVLFYKIYTK